MLSTVVSRLVTTRQAAEAIGVSPGTLLRWVKQGSITPAEQTMGGPHGPGHFRWDLADLRRQLAERKR